MSGSLRPVSRAKLLLLVSLLLLVLLFLLVLPEIASDA